MKFNFGSGMIGLILMATSLLFLWFVILSGLNRVTPFRNTYFLQADTSGITGARDVSRWTYFWVCDGNTARCSSASAAWAFGKAWDYDAQNIPNGVGGPRAHNTTSNYLFNMWRATWCFFIITLFFESIAFFTSFISCFGKMGALIASMATFVALFFSTLAVSLMTATFVKARNYFHNAGRSAKVGSWAFGFAWAHFVALGLAWLAFNIGIFTGRSKNRGRTVTTEKRSGNPWRQRNTSALGDGRRVGEAYA